VTEGSSKAVPDETGSRYAANEEAGELHGSGVMKYHCKETLQRAYLYLDGEVLSETERREIQIHLEDCQPCLERVGLDKEVTLLLARIKGSDPCPEGLKARLGRLFDEA
jgi:mycothiol system anti-sigma-R factor